MLSWLYFKQEKNFVAMVGVLHRHSGRYFYGRVFMDTYKGKYFYGICRITCASRGKKSGESRCHAAEERGIGRAVC